MSNTTEGFIDVPGGRVWYESRGEGPGILLLHGGPGADSGYLAPLMDLAADGYQVIRYDQLGSWKSDKPDDLTLWEVPRFVDEIEAVREHLGLDTMRLIGQSWGAFLALEYSLQHQDRLASLVLYSGAASTAQCVEGMNDLRSLLPEKTQLMMARFEATGQTSHPEYLSAFGILMRKHLCRLDPWPDELIVSMGRLGLPVYNTMWGPNEFTCTGTLRSWDRTERLGEIRVPTLIMCGRYDEVIPACSETMHAGIEGSEFTVFEKSSHLAHYEEPEAFFSTLRGFLAKTAAG